MARSERIPPEMLTAAIADLLEEWDGEVIEAADREAKKAVQKLARQTRAAARANGWQEYPGSIASKLLRRHSRGSTDVWYVKAQHYRLSHLLEYGHATRNGGRTRAFGFIRKEYDAVEKEFEENMRRAIGAIG